MYRELAHLLLYSDLGEGAILTRLAGIFRDWEHGADRDEPYLCPDQTASGPEHRLRL